MAKAHHHFHRIELIGRAAVQLLGRHRATIPLNLASILATVFELGRWCGGDGVSGTMGVLGDLDVLSGRKSLGQACAAGATTASQYLWNVLVSVVRANYAEDVTSAAEAYKSDVSLVGLGARWVHSYFVRMGWAVWVGD